jgi:hypothetical protein
LESVKATISTYRAFLQELLLGRELDLKNSDEDTGAATKPGEYGLADKTYSKLLRDLAQRPFCLRNARAAREHFGFLFQLSLFQGEDEKVRARRAGRTGTTAGQIRVSGSCRVVQSKVNDLDAASRIQVVRFHCRR